MGRQGAAARVWCSGARPRRTDVAATKDCGGTAVAAGEDLETVSPLARRHRRNLDDVARRLSGRRGAALATRPETAEDQARRGDGRIRPAAPEHRCSGGRTPFGPAEAEAM